MTRITDLPPSVRERIVRFLQTALDGLQNEDNSAIPVFRARLDALPEVNLPAFNLTIEKDERISLSTDSIEHSLIVNVDCLISAGEADEDATNPPQSIDQLADPLTVWAEQSVMRDITMGGLAIRTDWVDSVWTNVAQNLDLSGVRKRFAITYFSAPGDPTDSTEN